MFYYFLKFPPAAADASEVETTERPLRKTFGSQWVSEKMNSFSQNLNKGERLC